MKPLVRATWCLRCRDSAQTSMSQRIHVQKRRNHIRAQHEMDAQRQDKIPLVTQRRRAPQCQQDESWGTHSLCQCGKITRNRRKRDEHK